MERNSKTATQVKRNGTARPLRVGIIGYEGVQALDLIGPGDAFSMLPQACPDAAIPGYEVMVLGLNSRPFRSESGIVITPNATLADSLPLDTVIIPGGSGLRKTPSQTARIIAWLQACAAKIRRVASICTGIYALAASGLLDGRRATTHWRYCHDVAQRYPAVRLDSDPLYTRDGRFYTSAGVTAGIDLALAFIEEDYGPKVALRVARELVVYLKRPGGQEQYSEPLRFQVSAADPFADLVLWVRSHLQDSLTVEALAERANLSPRQFSRKFKVSFGVSPGEFVESTRLDEARRRLATTSSPVRSVADSVGFSSPDTFRRAFERRFGITPSLYRSRFSL